eukprot:m.75869 g.75869  ORF g.75869 m.75869 type:complete len:100 (+) comp24834_c0_seq1:1604-1903(+)
MHKLSPVLKKSLLAMLRLKCRRRNRIHRAHHSPASTQLTQTETLPNTLGRGVIKYTTPLEDVMLQTTTSQVSMVIMQKITAYMYEDLDVDRDQADANCG